MKSDIDKKKDYEIRWALKHFFRYYDIGGSILQLLKQRLISIETLSLVRLEHEILGWRPTAVTSQTNVNILLKHLI